MYEMKIRVRYSEVDREGIARLHQILEYFQDCGTFQSEELGLGVEEDQKNHRAWYLIAWNVKIIRHPRAGSDNCFCGGNMDSDEYTEDASNESHKGNR